MLDSLLRRLIPPQRPFEMFYKMLIFVGVLAVGKVDAVPSAVLTTQDAGKGEIMIASLEAKVKMLEAELAKQTAGASVVAQKERNVTATQGVGCSWGRACACRWCEPWCMSSLLHLVSRLHHSLTSMIIKTDRTLLTHVLAVLACAAALCLVACAHCCISHHTCNASSRPCSSW